MKTMCRIRLNMVTNTRTNIDRVKHAADDLVK